MRENTADVAQQLLIKTENILNHSESTYLTMGDFLGKPCSKQIIENMQNVVAEGLYLRNTSFFQHGKIYCSSAPEAIGLEIRSADKFTAQRMLLFTDRFVTKGVPLFATRLDKNGLGIVSIIDGRYLQNMLEINNSNTKLFSYLKVGSSWIENSGESHNTALPELDFVTTVHGRTMPVEIVVGVKPMTWWQHLWAEYWLGISSVVLASLIFSAFIYLLLARPRSVKKVLNHALKRGEFVPWLQGIVDKHGNLCGAEVLMRWQTSSGEIINPDIFIPAAEKSGLIVPMTTSMLPELQRYFLQQRALIPSGFVLSLNICKLHFQNLGLVDECREFLKVFPEQSLVLCLEITERELIEQTSLTDLLLKQLDEIGVKIAIDDFGTGHASFNYMRSFKVDFIKIDRAFINTIGSASISASLVDIIIDMAAKLGMEVVAEGVESGAQAEYLIAHNVAKLQGFYYHKPVPLALFSAKFKHYQ
ncbi:EAL domain-containing protein [Buttiauxella warmboldiae]|nr:cyclic diguanylate phosphodiesterase [Buttiauxella warmboldiae]